MKFMNKDQNVPQTLLEIKKGDNTVFSYHVLQEMREGKYEP